MTKLVIDSSAWIEYFSGTGKGAKVRELITNNEAYTTSISLSEISSKFKRSNIDPWKAINIILSNSKIVNTDNELSINVGILHAETRPAKSKFSLSDAHVLQSARKLQAKVVTSDYGFKGFKETILL